MKLIYNALSRWPDYARLEGAVAGGALPAAVTGLSGIHKCCVIASLCQKTGRRALVLAADEAEAQRFCEDLRALGLRPLSYPLRDFGFRDAAGTSHEYERLRLEVRSKLENGTDVYKRQTRMINSLSSMSRLKSVTAVTPPA